MSVFDATSCRTSSGVSRSTANRGTCLDLRTGRSAVPDAEKRPPGRPTVHGPRTSTAIRLKPELHERLSAEGAARDVSINFLVNKAVEFFLDRLIPVDEMQWTREP